MLLDCVLVNVGSTDWLVEEVSELVSSEDDAGVAEVELDAGPVVSIEADMVLG